MFKSFYHENRIVISVGLICLILTFTLVLYLSHTTHEINQNVCGILFQAGDIDTEEFVEISINGKYYTTFFGKPKRFHGQIIVGKDMFQLTNMPFHENYTGILTKHGSTFGDLYISDTFQEITITLTEKLQDGSLGWGSDNGRIISAPAKNRNEAMKLSNRLLRVRYKEIMIN